jgi:hypothetical protein
MSSKEAADGEDPAPTGTKKAKVELGMSRFDNPSENDLAMIDPCQDIANPYCAAAIGHRVSGNELYEAIRPMEGKPPEEFSDEEIDRVISVLRGADAVYMQGSSPEAQSAVGGFYGAFSEFVLSKPKLQAELDPFYVSVDFAGQAQPPTFAARVAALPAALGTVDISPNLTNSMFRFGGAGQVQHLNARTFIGHMGSHFGVGGSAAPPIPIHFSLLHCVVAPMFWY